MALSLKIDGVEYIQKLRHESLTVSQIANRLNSICSFDLIITDVIQEDVWTVGTTRVEDGDVISGHALFADPKAEVIIEDGATKYFGGILSRITVHPKYVVDVRGTLDAESQIITCHCHDFSQILEESIVTSYERYATKTDEEIIDDIFGKYVAGIDFATHVAGGAYTFNVISFQDMTVREVMDALVSYTGYEWYIDYDKKLHYSVDGDAPPAWHLSDAPDQVNSFSYLNPVKRDIDATNLVNRVFIVGSSESAWYEDATSIAEYGTHQAIIKDTSLTTTANLATRGNAILDAFKDPVITYTIHTYKDGLRAGMEVRLVCAHLDVDASFPLRKLTVKFPVDGSPIYTLTLGGLDYSAGAPLPPPLLALGATGWSHTIGFTATDLNTVLWLNGVITTVEGQVFNIVFGNTGDMVAGKTYFVYLDIDVSTTILQVTNDESAALGDRKLVIACCWPGTTLAGFQVFGISSPAAGESIMAANASNIGAGVVTGTEVAALAIDTGHLAAGAATDAKIDVSKLSDINVDMGTLTAGTIQTAGAGNDRVVINIADGIRGIDAADVVQFQLDPADGVAKAGAGAVILDVDGLRTIRSGAELDKQKIRFMYDDSGTERKMGQLYSGWAGGAARCITWMHALRVAADPWPANVEVILAAIDTIAGADVRLCVQSGGLVKVSGSTYFSTNADVRVGGGLYVGQIGVDPPADDIHCDGDVRVGGGLYVGSTVINPDVDDIVCDGTIAVGYGDHWKLGDYTAGTRTDTGFVDVNINGVGYRLLCELP